MKNILTLITIFAALAGCSEEPDENLERIALSILLNSTWASACVIDENGTDSYIPSLTFTPDDVTQYNSGSGSSSNIYYLGDTTCLLVVTDDFFEPEIRDLYTFDYSLGNDVTVDGTVADITLATEIDMTNTTEGSNDFGAMNFDIFAITDDRTIYFGNADEPNNGSTIELRPTQLSESPTFSR